VVLLALAAGCGGSDAPAEPEIVVDDAAASGDVTVVGATRTHVFWTAGSHVEVAATATLPAAALELGTTTGNVAHAGDSVIFAADAGLVAADVTGELRTISRTLPETFAGSDTSLPAFPMIARSTGAVVDWGIDDVTMSTTLNKVDRCDHMVVTRNLIYVAADGAQTRRLLWIDQRTGIIAPGTGTASWASMFAGGGMPEATYTGRIVDADDNGALWLVEEMPSQRALLVSDPVQGDAAIVLANIQGASGFFASSTYVYWQEGSELLSAPRVGGSASIVATLPGAAGAFADGYVYFVHGRAIERLRVE
jgi:hypothetical protein